jgi:type I restriction enzyme S subunit
MGKNVGAGCLLLDECERVKPTFHRSQAKSQLRPGDVVVVRIGKSGQAAKIPPSLGDANCSGLVIVKQPRGIDADYLVYYLNSPQGRAYSHSHARGSTRLTLNTSSVAAALVPVPPLPEQRRIVAILDEAFEGIAAAKANAERNLGNAREVFGGWFEETLSAIGTSSVVKPLGDVCQIQTGKKDVNEGNPGGRYPFFTCAAEPTYSDEYSFDTEAILIAGNGNVGQAQYFTGKFEAYQRTYVLTNFRGVTGAYLFRTIDKRLNRKMLQQKLGNTMPYIKMGMLQEFPIPVPDAATQASVTERAESLGAEVNRLEQRCDSRLAALDELKASLLHQAFTGQL